MTNREFFLHLCSDEYPRFLRALQAAPPDQLEYRPHPGSRSAHELIGHLIGHEQDLLELAATGTIHHRTQVAFGDVDEAVNIYSTAHHALKPALSALEEAQWETIGGFYIQGNLVMEAPRGELAWMVLLDAIHHRGQLSTYLRPMGGTVPSIYGPSGDTTVAKA